MPETYRLLEVSRGRALIEESLAELDWEPLYEKLQTRFEDWEEDEDDEDDPDDE